MLKFVIFSGLLGVGGLGWLSFQVFLFGATFVFGVFMLCDYTWGGVGFYLGVDSVSSILILLSVWIAALLVGSSQGVMDKNNFSVLFLGVNGVLLLSLVLTFSSLDYLVFYICFESSLIPTLILILGWGYQPERLQAGVYMLFYTLFASLPLLVSLLSMYSVGGSLSMNLSLFYGGAGFVGLIWYVCTVLAFVVKLPMFLVHLWLPKAHVEAPVAGSMVLAGVLLKLGGYGLIRVIPVFVGVGNKVNWAWVSLGGVGGVMVSLMCLRQTDIKALIAYSSVAHMGLVLCGLMLLSWWGLSGAMAVMVGHGLCSSGLFCLANMVYERLGSRSLLISKGLMNFMPSMALWWFLLSIGNMAAPPTLNLCGEVSLLLAVVGWSLWSMLVLGLLSFFSAAYTLYLFSLSQHGKYFSSLFSCCSGKVREYTVLMLHWLPLNIFILKGEVVMCS